jgi:hypothetical protein
MTALPGLSFESPVRSPSRNDGRIAFRARIGVTGHRSIENREEVELAVIERLKEIREMFPPSRFTPVVFSMLSALAEGADRLVASVALGSKSEFEIELGAVLPLAVEEYCEDFKTEGSRREFHDLLLRSRVRIELEHEQSPSEDERNAAYDRAGHYIVDHSDVLIAVWDGRESNGRGGTAEVVRYAYKRKVPVLVVPAETLSTDEPPSNGGRRLVEPGRRGPKSLAFRRIDSYNRVSLNGSRNLGKIDSEQARLDKAIDGSSIRDRYTHVADWALPHLARADELAVFNHRLQTVLAWAIHLLAAFAVTVVAVQTLFLSDEPIWLVGEVVLVLLLLLAVVTGRYARLHDRWIGYRSLAEAFRSALFLVLSGGGELLSVTSTGVLGESEEAWFQRAFSQAWRSAPEISLDHGEEAAALRDFLVEAWLDHQISYHCRAARRCKTLHSLCTWTMGLLASVTVVVALLHIAEVGDDSWVGDALKLCALTLPAFGGAVAGLREFGHLRLHEERSKRAVIRLRSLRNRLVASNTLTSVQHLAGDAQRVMEEETLDWYGVVEFQDVEIVI